MARIKARATAHLVNTKVYRTLTTIKLIPLKLGMLNVFIDGQPLFISVVTYFVADNLNNLIQMLHPKVEA